jgi:hypothetical protein
MIIDSGLGGEKHTLPKPMKSTQATRTKRREERRISNEV